MKLKGQTILILLSDLKSASLLRLAVTLFPFVIYAYLFRVVGSESVGIIVYAFSVIAFFRVLINFGFEISAIVEITNLKKHKLREQLYSSVILCQLLLFLVSAFILFLSIYIYEFKYSEEYAITFLMLFGEIFWTKWFYQGIHQLKYLARMSIFSELIILLLTVLLVKEAKDYIYYLYIRSLVTVIMGFVSLTLIKLKLKYFFFFPKLEVVIYVFTKSKKFFVSRVFAVFHDELIVLIIGSYFSIKDVAYYDIARKVLNAFLIPNSIINTISFPYISRTKDKIFAKKVFYLRNLLASLFVFLVVIYPNLWLTFMSGGRELLELNQAKTYLLGMSGLLIIRATLYYSGTSLLVSFGYESIFNRSVIYTFIVFLFCVCLLVMVNKITVINLILIVLFTETFEAMYRFYYCKKFKIL